MLSFITEQDTSNVGVLSDVRSSVFDIPVSVASVMSGAFVGALGREQLFPASLIVQLYVSIICCL